MSDLGHIGLSDRLASRRRLFQGCDTGKQNVDSGTELLAVVVLAQVRRRLAHVRVLAGIQLQPTCRDSVQEARSVRVTFGADPSVGSILPGDAENVIHQRAASKSARSGTPRASSNLPMLS